MGDDVLVIDLQLVLAECLLGGPQSTDPHTLFSSRRYKYFPLGTVSQLQPTMLISTIARSTKGILASKISYVDLMSMKMNPF